MTVHTTIPWSPRSLKAIKIVEKECHASTPGTTLYLLLGLLGLRACAAANACRHFDIQHSAVETQLTTGDYQETASPKNEQWTDTVQKVFQMAITGQSSIGVT